MSISLSMNFRINKQQKTTAYAYSCHFLWLDVKDILCVNLYMQWKDILHVLFLQTMYFNIVGVHFRIRNKIWSIIVLTYRLFVSFLCTANAYDRIYWLLWSRDLLPLHSCCVKESQSKYIKMQMEYLKTRQYILCTI